MRDASEKLKRLSCHTLRHVTKRRVYSRLFVWAAWNPCLDLERPNLLSSEPVLLILKPSKLWKAHESISLRQVVETGAKTWSARPMSVITLALKCLGCRPRNRFARGSQATSAARLACIDRFS